jgi:hypothetical protein
MRSGVAVAIALMLFMLLSIPVITFYQSLVGVERSMSEATLLVGNGKYDEASDVLEELRGRRMLSYDRTNLMLLELIVGYYTSGGSDPTAMSRIEELKKRQLIEEQRVSVGLIEVLVLASTDPRSAISLAREMERSEIPEEMRESLKIVELASLLSLERMSESEADRAEELLNDKTLFSWLESMEETRSMVPELERIKRYWPVIRFGKGVISVSDIPDIFLSLLRLVLDMIRGDTGAVSIKSASQPFS